MEIWLSGLNCIVALVEKCFQAVFETVVKVYRSFLDNTVVVGEEWFWALDSSLVVVEVWILNSIQVVGKVCFLNSVQVVVEMWFVDRTLVGVEVLFLVFDNSVVVVEVGFLESV
jgi:cbb3-type cytochrome oxidase subunit 1